MDLQASRQPLPTRIAEHVRSFDRSRYVVYLGFAVVFGFFSIALRDTGFFTVSNLQSIVELSTPIVIMSIATAFTLSAGEIDLSIGSVVGLAALSAAVTMQNAGAPAGVLVGLGVATAVGLFNGLVAVKLRIPSFLVTLGTMSIAFAITQAMTDLISVPITDNAFNSAFGSGAIGPIPVLVVWSAVALLVGHLALRSLRFGSHVLAVGGNREAARAVGINTDRVRIGVLVLSAAAAGLAGLLYAGQLQGAQYTLGSQDLLTVVAATVIGGTSLFGGRGSVVGAVLGALLLGVLNNGLILMGFGEPQQLAARGALIIVAVALGLREPKE